MSLQPQHCHRVSSSPAVFLGMSLTAVVVESQCLVPCRACLVPLWPQTELLLSFPCCGAILRSLLFPEWPQTLWCVSGAHPVSQQPLAL